MGYNGLIFLAPTHHRTNKETTIVQKLMPKLQFVESLLNSWAPSDLHRE